MRDEVRTLWELTLAPGIWCVFFLVAYVSAAVFCAKAGDPSVRLEPVRAVIGVGAAIALVSIAVIGGAAWRRWRDGQGERDGAQLPVHADDSSQSRARFLDLAIMLLSALSAVATLYVAMPALFIVTCR